MAAYAALVSLMNIIHDIQHHHSPPISIHQQQLQSLTQTLSSLLQFLEASKSPVADGDEADPFEMRIADATYAVEDAIESYLVDTIHLNRIQLQQTRFVAAKRLENADDRQTNFYHDLQRVIEEMDSINRIAVEMDAEKAVAVHAHDVSAPAATFRSSSSSKVMVCSDDLLNDLMEKLIGGGLARQVIPVVGMGGIGKTTLALNIYQRKIIDERFDLRAWATISQKYNKKEILCGVLAQVTNQNEDKLHERSEDKLGKELYQYLFGRRYLIAMDDMWCIDAWERIQNYFPNNENGSRILVTTRLSQLCSQLNPSYSLQMEFLDEVNSWDLFSTTVFGEGSCPPELLKIGKMIVENCRGLPLSIVVVGGLLKTMPRTRKCWESIRDNLTSVVNSENDNHCLRLLKLSYNHLPVYLKPCFLYMGIFEEDDIIKASTIVKLWVSEGFLKPMEDGSLETMARGYLKDLVDRNLILIDKMGSTGNIKSCRIHDLLRDLCLNEGQKQGFHHVVGRSQGMNKQCRRVAIPKNTSKKEVYKALQTMSGARSVICKIGKVPSSRNFRLLRTFHAYKSSLFFNESYTNSVAFQYVNLRHLAVEVRSTSSFFSSLNLHWNLHELIVSCPNDDNATVPVEFWKMCQFRHIESPQNRLCLPDPPVDGDTIIMENLQVLKGVRNFKCSEEVVKRIPNIKKLKTQYVGQPKGSLSFHDDDYCISNIQYLSKLENLYIASFFEARIAPYLRKLSFPDSLKSLTLGMNVEFEWEEILQTMGSLPHLEKLKLWIGCFGSGKWEMVEGQFPNLKYLGLFAVSGLKEWRMEESCVMPRLEQLILHYLEELEEIPSEIGNIATLQRVFLQRCGESVVRSAKAMVEEQGELQGAPQPFHLQVVRRPQNRSLLNLWKNKVNAK